MAIFFKNSGTALATNNFSLETLYNMHIKANEKNILNTSASCSLAINLGMKVNFVEGSEKNLKITVKDDLDIFKALLSEN